ncbi:hypothetical protein QEN19_002098 [Hanseniaspora menglaensis]
MSSSNPANGRNDSTRNNKHLQTFEEELDNLDIQSLDFDIEDLIINEDDLDLNNDIAINNVLGATDDASTYELNSLRNIGSKSSLLSYPSHKKTFNKVTGGSNNFLQSNGG